MTLIESVVAIALVTTLLAFSAGALNYYLAGRSIDVAADGITTEIRKAQSLAVSTGAVHRIVYFEDDAYQMFRLQVGEWMSVGGVKSLPSGVYFHDGSPPAFGGDRYHEFYARGTSEDGSISLQGKYGKSKFIWVDGETVNVHTI